MPDTENDHWFFYLKKKLCLFPSLAVIHISASIFLEKLQLMIVNFEIFLKTKSSKGPVVNQVCKSSNAGSFDIMFVIAVPLCRVQTS